MLRRGFTLIELLIVVAIIAILAAIAVPNFLEAQVRAKIGRSRSDMRTYSLALESYMIDNNTYPNDSDDSLLSPTQKQNGFLRLTTPIAYISSLMVDPFVNVKDFDKSEAAPYYEMGSGADNMGWGASNGPKSYGPQGSGNKKVQAWIINGVCSDRKDNTNENDYWPWRTTCLAYDASNGTTSSGDLYRIGGNYKVGTYRVNGQLRGEFP